MRRLRALVPWLLLLGAVLVLGPARSRVAAAHAQLKETSDGYGLPGPEGAKLLSLGHRAAVADLVYAHVLVSYGLHFEEKRRFERAADYLDVVTELDPTFTEPYLFADTLVVLQPMSPREEDYWRARSILLRGTKNLPYNRRVFITAGQYIAYLAAPNLKDRDDELRWRVEGAKLLARACELASEGGDGDVGQCLSAARYLNAAGERSALIRMMRRSIAVNDDEASRAEALAILEKYVGQEERERYAQRDERFRRAWQRDLPHASKERILILGPRFDPFVCPVHQDGAECVKSWREWGALVDAQ